MTSLRPPAAGAAVRTAGRYEVVRELGRGGMAVVYLARQTDLDRLVALKELAAFHAADPAFVERFLREARLAGSLNHPNIVTVHEYFEHEGTPFIAMEYFERGSLRPFVEGLSLPQVIGVLEGLLAGLEHAELRGVVHRDLKPENVMVSSSGGVKIADFGLAKAIQDRPGGSLTATGATVGTPAYMAPEQATDGRIGAWTDLYALGVMAYELLSGNVPFHEQEAAVAVLLRHMNEPVTPLQSVVPGIDPRLSAWVERLLAKEPEQRPANAGRAWDELEEVVLQTLGPRWRREAPLPLNGVPAAGADTATGATLARPSPPLPGRSRRRLRWAAGAVALAAVVAGAVLAALGLTSGSSKQPSGNAQPLPGAPVQAQTLSLGAGGNSVYVSDRSGRVLELSPASLRNRSTLTDPAGPRSVLAAGDRVYVADGEGVTVVGAGTARPLAAERFPGALALAGGSGAPLAAISSRGRLCLLGAGARLHPCADLGFTPSGLGSAPSGAIAVANGKTGAVVLYRRIGQRLASLGAPVAVGSDPRGGIVSFRGRFYAPVQGGIAVVDPQARRRVRLLHLPATPAAVWIVPFSGRVFAALPSVGRVAVLDTAFPGSAVTMVRAGKKPIAVSGGLDPEGAGEAVYVLDGLGTVSRLDPITGERLGSAPVAGLRGPTRKLVLRKASLSRRGRSSVITLALAGGGLDPSGLVVRDGRIADGRALVELWQGGIRSTVARGALGPLSLRVGRATGRLGVALSAPPGTFARLVARRPNRSTVVITLVEPETSPVAPTAPTRPTGPQTTTQATTTQPATPEKPRPPAHKPKHPASTTTTPTIPTG